MFHFRLALILVFEAIMPIRALAGQTVAFPAFDIRQTIEGEEVVLPLRLWVSAETPQSRVDVDVEINLADLIAKADVIIGRALAGPIGKVGGLKYKGTLAGIDGEALRLKVHFIYGAGLLDTDGSVILRLALKADGVAVRLMSAARPELNVSNDIARAAIAVAGIETDLETAATEALDKLFADPRAALALPEGLAASGLTIESARFGTGMAGAGVAFVQASLPPAQ